MVTPDEIETLLSKYGSNHGGELPAADEEAQKKRTDLLSEVVKTCRELWESKSEELDQMAEKIGNGSRDVAWRLPYGESGLLEFFVRVLASDNLRQPLAIHSLRMVGNSCADMDENRGRLVENELLKNVISYLDNMKLLLFAVPVTFNILVDYEPAQQLASKLNTHSKLINILKSPSISEYEPIIPYIAHILRFLVPHEPEQTLAIPDTAFLLLNQLDIPQDGDDEEDDPKDFITIATTMAAYLANENVQKAFVEDESKRVAVNKVFDVYYYTIVTLDSLGSEDEDVADNLKLLRRTLLACISGITAIDSFTKHFPSGSTPLETFLGWLKSDNYQLQTAACLSLGNLSRSDEASLVMVKALGAYEPVAQVVADPNNKDMQLLHAALAFAKNLAIPEQNKLILGQCFLKPGVILRVLAMEVFQQVQFAAVSLTRLLLVGSPANVRLLCEQLEVKDNEDSKIMTIVDEVLTLFKKTDVEPTKMEASRAILTLCRVMHSDAYTKTEESAEERAQVYKKHELHKALPFLITQQKWPIVRSEAWFIFAVMCRSKDGTPVVLKLLEDDAAMAALTETITGRKTGEIVEVVEVVEESEAPLTLPGGGLELEPQQLDPSRLADIKSKDRENALIMCTEILKGADEELESTRKQVFQDLVKEGTLLVARERKSAT